MCAVKLLRLGMTEEIGEHNAIEQLSKEIADEILHK